MSRLERDGRACPAGAIIVPEGATASKGRFFLGVTLTDDARHAIQRHLEAAAIPGCLMLSEDWHITLRFLGETSPEALKMLRQALGTADLGRLFDIVFGSLDAFPDPERAGVIWLGIGAGAPTIAALAARVESCVREAGFPAETRPYTPHVTLSRLRLPADVSRLVERFPALHERMVVDAVVLFQSGLGGGPKRYEVIERFPLLAAP